MPAIKRRRHRKKLYCVIGLRDSQRWAQSYWAENPEEAERLAWEDCGGDKSGLEIAAVLHGKELVA